MRALTICMVLAATAFAGPASADPGDILVKVRGGYVFHSGSSRVTVEVDDTSLSATAKSAVGGEASLTFFLTEHVAAELAFGGSSYDLEDASGRTLSSAGMITPTAMLQYHLLPESRVFRPYVGAGVSYANFYSEKPGELLTDRSTDFPISYSTGLSGSLVPVGQIGADIAVNDQFYVNIDAKYLGGNSKFRVDAGGNKETVSHRMRSIIIGAGVGFKF